MFLEYSVSEYSKFAVRFLYTLNDAKELMWVHDVDSKYFKFPMQSFLTAHNKRKAALRNIQESDIKCVIDALLFHPRAHQHIESPLDKHEIRIGDGIDNAFLFLFHLRYQLCPIQEKRSAEKQRIIRLFYEAIQTKIGVTANDLMAQPKII